MNLHPHPQQLFSFFVLGWDWHKIMRLMTDPKRRNCVPIGPPGHHLLARGIYGFVLGMAHRIAQPEEIVGQAWELVKAVHVSVYGRIAFFGNVSSLSWFGRPPSDDMNPSGPLRGKIR